MATIVSDNSWRFQALCAGVEDLPKAFGDSEDEDEPYDTEDALDFIDKYCISCEVMVQCGLFAKKNAQEFGVFGGLLPSERNVLDTHDATE